MNQGLEAIHAIMITTSKKPFCSVWRKKSGSSESTLS